MVMGKCVLVSGGILGLHTFQSTVGIWYISFLCFVKKVWWTSNCTHDVYDKELGLLNKFIVYWSAPSPKTRDDLQ